MRSPTPPSENGRTHTHINVHVHADTSKAPALPPFTHTAQSPSPRTCTSAVETRMESNNRTTRHIVKGRAWAREGEGEGAIKRRATKKPRSTMHSHAQTHTQGCTIHYLNTDTHTHRGRRMNKKRKRRHRTATQSDGARHERIRHAHTHTHARTTLERRRRSTA